MKTRVFLTFFAFLLALPAFACETCKGNQPKLLRDITHGAGPEGNIDYIITIIATIIVVLTLLYSAYYLFKPGEKNPNHIKNIVIDQK